MADTLPPRNLPPEAEAWGRKIEELLRDAGTGAARARQIASNLTRTQVGASVVASQQQEAIVEQAAQVAEQKEQLAAVLPIVAPSIPPGVPTAPLMETLLGVVSIGWDGQFVELTTASRGMFRVIAEVSLVEPTLEPDPGPVDPGELQAPWEDPTPWQVTGQPLLDAGSVSIPVEVGQPVWARLYAINPDGTASKRSAISTIVAEGVVVGQIADGAVIADSIAAEAITIEKLANGAVTSEKIAAGAVGQAEIADFALTAKKFNTGRHMLY
ncbi:hypothetical protein MRBLMI12_000504 [Microbacterium sp. LMI12-1-1.1]|uniref:hypothetical protein n=1 Tax=Microbacterium sp. LMI12-1-1.1 TaxID=3135225 RepID=UPI00342B41F7